MERRSRLIIAATLVAIGIGVASLSFLSEESTVRYVWQLHEEPEAHDGGSFTLLGIPQPAQLPGGVNNSAYAESITNAWFWNEGGVAYVTEVTSSVQQTGPGQWRFTLNQQTTPQDSQQVIANSTTTWDLAGDFQLFQVDDFESGEKTWATFGGVLNGDIQPKPSQLSGALNPDAPRGLLIWTVEPDGYTVGCSSKFLPDEVRDEYDADGDGTTD